MGRYYVYYYFLLVAFPMAETVSGFTGVPSISQRRSSTRHHVFGKQRVEGSSKELTYNDQVFVNGKNAKGAIVGQKLTVVDCR